MNDNTKKTNSSPLSQRDLEIIEKYWPTKVGAPQKQIKQQSA